MKFKIMVIIEQKIIKNNNYKIMKFKILKINVLYSNVKHIASLELKDPIVIS